MPIRPLRLEERSTAEVVGGPVDTQATISPRVVQTQFGTIGATWEQDGVQVDPGTVTLTITNGAGVNIVTNAVTQGATGPTRYYVLSPSQTATLDFFTCTWTASNGSTLTTYVEVSGGFLFSIAQARQLSPLQDTVSYTTESLLYYRMMAEMALEDICGVAFVPRYSNDTARIVGYGLLEVPRRKVKAVRGIYTMTNSGPMPLTNLTGLRIEPSGLIYMPSFFNWWSTPITVAYEHGYDRPPPRVGRAARELMRRWLLESPWDERTVAFRTRDGGELDLQTAKTDPFDIPEVIAVSEMYGTPMIS